MLILILVLVPTDAGIFVDVDIGDVVGCWVMLILVLYVDIGAVGIGVS